MTANANSGHRIYAEVMDPARLRTFQVVARRGSMSQAASALALTQPAVSRQIASLERELGTTLVRRVARGVVLTEPGRVFLRHAEDLLGRTAAARREIAAMSDHGIGRMALAAFSSANAWLVPRAIATFARRHPAVELSLAELMPDDALRGVHAGEIDVGVVTMIDPPRDARCQDLQHAHVLDDEFLVALSRHHPLAASQTVNIHELRDEPWIEAASDAHARPALRACADAGFEPRLAFRSDNWGARMSLVATGIGVALLPRLGIGAAQDDVVLRPLVPQPPGREVFAVWRAGTYASPTLESMVDALRTAATR